jgi:hypothetical protein
MRIDSRIRQMQAKTTKGSANDKSPTSTHRLLHVHRQSLRRSPMRGKGNKCVSSYRHCYYCIAEVTEVDAALLNFCAEWSHSESGKGSAADDIASRSQGWWNFRQRMDYRVA